MKENDPGISKSTISWSPSYKFYSHWLLNENSTHVTVVKNWTDIISYIIYIYHCYNKQIYLPYNIIISHWPTVEEWEWDFYVFPGFESALFLLGKTSLVLSKANPGTLTKIPFFQHGQSHFQISFHAQKCIVFLLHR